MANLLRATLTRRGALTGIAAAGVALLTGTWTARARAQAPAGAGGALPHESGNDPLGKSLGYTDQATDVDKAKYPTYKPGQMCDKCRFFKGSAGQKYGPCQIFVGKDVSASGWCVSFSPK